MLGRFGQTEQSAELLAKMRVLSLQAAIIFLVTGFAIDVLQGDSMDDVAIVFEWVAVILAGGPIIWSAVRGLAHGHAHVDELVAIAIVVTVAATPFLPTPMIG